MSQELIVPERIPWSDLTGKDLEECVFWLLDEIGAKDLEWRVGGVNQGGTDEGRDLECVFYMAGPDSELLRQKWCVETKGRKRTVEPAAVKNAVLNVQNTQEVDVLLIVTNSQFSNPTRDWIKEWMKAHQRPTIRLWDNNDLERLVSRHPGAVVRLFADALSTQGKLEYTKSQFWNHARHCGEATLRTFWLERRALTWDVDLLMAVVVSEMANGDISIRPWAAGQDVEIIRATFSHGLANCVPFIIRAEKAGFSQNAYIDAMAYLLLFIL